MIRALVSRIGRRGACLIFFGLLDVIYAFALANPGDARDQDQYTWLASIMPLVLWAGLWLLVGLVLLQQAWSRCDRVGFAAAMFLKLLWGLVALGGWIFGEYDRGYVSAAIWLAAAGFVWVLSGWPEQNGGRGPTWTRR